MRNGDSDRRQRSRSRARTSGKKREWEGVAVGKSTSSWLGDRDSRGSYSGSTDDGIDGRFERDGGRNHCVERNDCDGHCLGVGCAGGSRVAASPVSEICQM